MIVQKLQILIDANDRASKKLKEVEGRLKKMSGTLKKVGIASMAVGGAIVAAGAMMIKSYQEEERSVARLTHLTKQISNATDEQIQKLKDQAEALEKVGVVEGDVAMMGQSQLATFALNTEQIEMLTPALLDMIVATKGVNATQEDAISMANAVGRALEGGAGALTRYGISLTDAQKELFRLADKEERAALLAEILEGNFGGLNKATRETTEGGIKALRMSLGALMDAVGKPLAEALDKLVKEQLEPIVEKLKEWIDANPELTQQIVLWTVKAGLLLIPLGVILMILPKLVAGFTLLFGPIGAVVAAMTAGIFFAKQFKDSLEELFFIIERAGGWKETLGIGIREIIGKRIEEAKGIMGWMRGLLPFQEGGVVPGTTGTPVPILAHAGETITPAGKSAGNTFNFNFAGAIISNKEEFTRQITDIMNRKVRFSYLK